MKTNLIVLTGAGISAESGIKTFRDAGGLWEGFPVMDVASPEGWSRDPAKVLKFYNERRKQVLTVEPNLAHRYLVELEKTYRVRIITQNVDDLHERAGSSEVLHLHGELLKMRSTHPSATVYDCFEDIDLGDVCEKGYQLRPHIVWFGEAVPNIYEAQQWVQSADIVLVIGSSLQVYPAAGLVHEARPEVPVFYIDPKPECSEILHIRNLKVIPELASKGMEQLIHLLRELD
ncbi:MAG TPA: NAD-dependent deacylase [Saprospiraceae bacterium]|nr:NAD-dependent deacylase [Saprospiraceae bacterium]